MGVIETGAVNSLFAGTITALTWIASLLILTVIGAAAWLLARNLLKYNIRIVLFRKDDKSWRIFFDRAAVLTRSKKSDAGETTKEKVVKMLREKAELPISILQNVTYTQGFMHLVRVLMLKQVPGEGSPDYKPVAMRETSEAELYTIDFDTWQWLVDGVDADYQDLIKPRGLGAFLQVYGPYIAFGVLFAMLFAMGLIMMGDIKAVASGLQAAAEAAGRAGTQSLAAAP